MGLRVVEWLLLIGLMVALHALGSFLVLRLIGWFRPHWERFGSMAVDVLALTVLVASLALVHLAEVAIWALYYWGRGVLPDFETSAYYSLTTYTTVGYGDVVLPPAWRLFGTSEALVGILLTAWSTALLLGVVNVLHARTLGTFRRPVA